MATSSEDLLAASDQLMNTMFNIKQMTQTDKQIDNQDKQFYENLAWQTSENEINRKFLENQNANQLDFANRELAENKRVSDLNYALQSDTANFNRDMQQQAFDYQKQLNATQMEREDNAIQRQVADFAKAGFSPLAAIGGNGSSAGSLSTHSPNSVNPAQYDMSGINAAAGQYADFARQYAQLAFTSQQDYINKRTELAQKHNADITGARMALSQLRSDNYYKGQSASLQFYNTLINNRNKKLENQYLEEQLDNLRDEHKYNKEHGYRSESPVQALTSAVLEYINKRKQDGETTVEAAFDLTKEGAQVLHNTIQSGKDKVSQIVAKKIEDSDLSKKQKTAVMFYLTAIKEGFLTTKMGREMKLIYYLGETIYRKVMGYKD